MRPADVWGFSISPSSSSPVISARTVAGEQAPPSQRATSPELTGWPVSL